MSQFVECVVGRSVAPFLLAIGIAACSGTESGPNVGWQQAAVESTLDGGAQCPSGEATDNDGIDAPDMIEVTDCTDDSDVLLENVGLAAVDCPQGQTATGFSD